MLPDFLVIGAQRCGTTSLYKYLVAHPAVVAPPLGKGAHFFDVPPRRGINAYRAHFPTELYMSRVRRRSGQAVTGEASPYYIFHPLGARRIAEALPDVKLVAMLRDPVERAYSHHQHELVRGFEHLSFEEAIANEDERLAGERERMLRDPTYDSFSYRHHSYVARGLYAKQLEEWYSVCARDRILVLKSEAFFDDPDRWYGRVLSFLGLPLHLLPRYERHNPRTYTAMGPARRRSLAAHFREPNERLYDLLGEDLGWSR